MNVYLEGREIQTQEVKIIFRAKHDENLGPHEKQKDLSRLSYL